MEQFSSAAMKRWELHMSVEYWVKDNLGLEGNEALDRATDVMNVLARYRAGKTSE